MAYGGSRPPSSRPSDLNGQYSTRYGVNIGLVINGQEIQYGSHIGLNGLTSNIVIDDNNSVFLNGHHISANNVRRNLDVGAVSGNIGESMPIQCEEETSTMYDDMEQRLATFKTFPHWVPVTPYELAKAGFFFTGTADMVKCFSCHGRIRDWETGDTAFGEHRKFYPLCKFVVRQIDVGQHLL